MGFAAMASWAPGWGAGSAQSSILQWQGTLGQAWIQGISATPLALRGLSDVARINFEKTESTVLGRRESKHFLPAGSRGNNPGAGLLDHANGHYRRW